MSPSTDRSSDPSPFAWIFGLVLGALAAAGVAGAVRRRSSGGVPDDVSAATEPPEPPDAEGAPLAGHPS